MHLGPRLAVCDLGWDLSKLNRLFFPVFYNNFEPESQVNTMQILIIKLLRFDIYCTHFTGFYTNT